MSEDEEEYRHKKKKKYKNIESEEGEGEEKGNEEEEDSNSNNNKKRKNRKNPKMSDDTENDKNSSNEEEEKENSQEHANIEINLKQNKNISNEKEETNNDNNNIKENNENEGNKENKKSEAEYIAQIEGLENEIKLEKAINNKLKDSINPEEIRKLKDDLNEKNNMLEKLISTNKKQQSALTLLTRQLVKENKKRLKLKSPESQGAKSDDGTERSIKEGTKLDAINIVLKVKDKELFNATNKMNVLKSENEGLKKLLYENEDYNNNINMEDKAKEMSDKIEKSTKEKNLLIKQLKSHKKCIEDQKSYNEQYDNLKEELKDIKKHIQIVKNETKKLINHHQKRIINISINNKNNICEGFTSQNNKNKIGTCSSPNIHLNKNILTNAMGNKKGIILPLITSQTINQNESILTDSFTKKVKKYLDDEDEYDTLINKISNIEKSRKLIENKHKNELKQFISQIISLDEQYKLLNCDSKGSNCNIRVLKYKLNTIKGDNRQQSKKFNELKKELFIKSNISKEKDYEISLLIGQINSLRNLANYSNVEIPQDEISNYINKIKQEKIMETNEDENENDKEKEKEVIKKDNKDNKNKNKVEESIQADLPDSDYYNENEEYEEDEEVVKNNNKYKENKKK